MDGSFCPDGKFSNASTDWRRFSELTVCFILKKTPKAAQITCLLPRSKVFIATAVQTAKLARERKSNFAAALKGVCVEEVRVLLSLLALKKRVKGTAQNLLKEARGGGLKGVFCNV